MVHPSPIQSLDLYLHSLRFTMYQHLVILLSFHMAVVGQELQSQWLLFQVGFPSAW